MRVVYFGFPARSHTVPSLALIQELVSRGARVEYHSTSRFRSLIESAGAAFVAYPSVCEDLTDPRGLGDDGGVVAHAHRLADAASRMLRELVASVARPDLIIFDASALWGHQIGLAWKVPSVAFITTFAFTRGMLEMLGVAEAGVLDVLVPAADLKVICTSRYFQPSGRYFDASHLFVGPLTDRRPQDGVPVQPEGPRPLAYVSLGTIFNRNFELLRRIAGTLSSAGWQVVVALGDASACDSGEWPSHVRVYPFVNQMAALSIADIAVTHGGMGSISEILCRGVPAIIVPQAADQFLVARRTASLSAAVVVDPAAEFTVAWSTAISQIQTRRTELSHAATRIAQSFSDVTPLASAAVRIMQLGDAGRADAARA